MVPYPKALRDWPVLRQSELARYDDCPLTWRLADEHRRGVGSHDAARGQIVHRTLARCAELMEEHGESSITVDVAMDVFGQMLRQAEVPVRSVDGMSDEMVAIPLRQVAQARTDVLCWALYTSLDPGQFAGIERRLESMVAYPDDEGGMVERRITGRPDLLLISDDGLEATIKDWKSTWGLPPEKLGSLQTDETGLPENISDEGFFQQRFYGLLTFDVYQRVQRVTLEETYLRYLSGRVRDRRGRAINPVRAATIERDQLSDIRAELAALAERFDRSYETGVFAATPGSHCAFCVAPRRCSIKMPDARGGGRIYSAAEAERVAGQLMVARAAADNAARALRAWANAHGDVRVRDAKKPRVYGPVVRERVVKPDAEAVKRAVAEGRDPAELYEARETVEFCVHSPEEIHPAVAEARREEEALLAMERAAENRRKALAP